MINSIFFRNLKGQEQTQSLTGRDIFIGPNGSGKTTRIQALGLSFLGYVPGNGKTEAETFKLATGDEMAVGLRTSEGFGFERHFARVEDYNRKTGERTTKISQSVRVSPGQGESNDTQRKARIAAEVGSFPVMLDFSEFLNLSDAKRRDFIYGLRPIDSDEWTKERILEHLFMELCTGELGENNPEHYETMNSLIDEVMAQFPAGWNVSEGLQAMLDWVTAQQKLWNSKRKDAQGAVRQLAELKNSLEETDRNIASERAELDELQQKLIDVERQIAKDTEKKRAIDARTARMQELQRSIEWMEKNPAEAADVTGLERQIAELNEQIVSSDYTQENEALNCRLAEISSAVEPLNRRREDLRESFVQVRAGIATLDKSLETITGLGGVCVVDKRIACEKDFSKYRSWVESEREKAQAVAANLDCQTNDVVNQLNALIGEERQIRETLRQLADEERAVVNRNRELSAQIVILERQKNEALTAQERHENQINLYRNELSRLTNEPVEAIAPIDLLEKQADGLKTQIAALKLSVDEKGRARQTVLLAQQSMLENKTAELKAACLKSIGEALGPKGIQGELVKEILDPLLADIGANLKAMGFEYDPYFETESETGKEIFQFGWINEKGHRVNFDALSAGQQTVFLAAMMVTIVDRANPKVRVLVMDNINHLDQSNLHMLLEGLAAIEGRMDNIVLAGVIEFPLRNSDGWRIWDLGDVEAGYVAVEGGEKSA